MKKGDSAWIALSLCGGRSQNFSTTQSCFRSSNWFFECEHSFIDKPMVTKEAAVPIRPGFETVSYQHVAHAQQRFNSIHRVFLESVKIEQVKERICWNSPRDSPNAFFLCSACTNTSCNALVCSPSSTLIRAVYQFGSLPWSAKNNTKIHLKLKCESRW